mmetsp:Transcript_18688/g.28616  ORF Transcript_18688/g.28616 Transcript_18688/m.28616 type:complete len:306 (+) Transcript_18688:776-1693(+)
MKRSLATRNLLSFPISLPTVRRASISLRRSPSKFLSKSTSTPRRIRQPRTSIRSLPLATPSWKASSLTRSKTPAWSGYCRFCSRTSNSRRPLTRSGRNKISKVLIFPHLKRPMTLKTVSSTRTKSLKPSNAFKTCLAPSRSPKRRGWLKTTSISELKPTTITWCKSGSPSYRGTTSSLELTRWSMRKTTTTSEIYRLNKRGSSIQRWPRPHPSSATCSSQRLSTRSANLASSSWRPSTTREAQPRIIIQLHSMEIGRVEERTQINLVQPALESRRVSNGAWPTRFQLSSSACGRKGPARRRSRKS